jgi:hypothetical protein
MRDAIRDAEMNVDEDMLCRLGDATAFRWDVPTSPMEATSSTYEQEIECWAIAVGQFILQCVA